MHTLFEIKKNNGEKETDFEFCMLECTKNLKTGKNHAKIFVMLNAHEIYTKYRTKNHTYQ